jgi:hypothetical protein
MTKETEVGTFKPVRSSLQDAQIHKRKEIKKTEGYSSRISKAEARHLT